MTEIFDHTSAVIKAAKEKAFHDLAALRKSRPKFNPIRRKKFFLEYFTDGETHEIG